METGSGKVSKVSRGYLTVSVNNVKQKLPLPMDGQKILNALEICGPTLSGSPSY